MVDSLAAGACQRGVVLGEEGDVEDGSLKEKELMFWETENVGT